MTACMKGLLRGVAILLIVLTAMPGAMATRVSAQTSTAAYTSELSGLEVEATRDFAITGNEVNHYRDGTAAEFVDVDSGAGIIRISFYDDNLTPDAGLREFTEGFASAVDSFSMLGAGESDDTRWALAEASLNQADLYYYIAVTPDVVGNVDVMTVLTAPSGTFMTALEDAQVDVTVDGVGIFGEADLDALAALMSGEAAPDATATGQTGAPRTSTSGRGGATPAQTAAADVTTSEVTGIEVKTSGDWEIVAAEVYDETEPAEESFQIQSPNANGYIAFFHDDDARMSLNDFLSGFDTSAQSRENIAADYRNGIAWTLDEAVLGDGAHVYVYIEVREGLDPDYVVLSAVLAIREDFADVFAGVQGDISIDGDPIFADVDAADLEDLIAGGAVADQTPTGDSTRGAGAENPRDHAKLPDRDDQGANETETGTAVSRATALEEAGLLSETEYASPQYGVDVIWGDLWYVDASDDDGVTSDPARGLDSLVLVWDGPGFALMFVDISSADSLVPADFVEYWTSDEYMLENAEPEAENLIYRSRSANGAVLMRDYLTEGDEVIILKEARLLDDGEHLAITTLITTPDVFSEMYGDAQDDVSIGGAPAVETLTTRQVDRALAK